MIFGTGGNVPFLDGSNLWEPLKVVPTESNAKDDLQIQQGQHLEHQVPQLLFRQ